MRYTLPVKTRVTLLSIGLLIVSVFTITIPQVKAQTLDSWSDAKPMHFARSDHTATLLNDSRVLVVGGANMSSYFSSAEIYDASTNSWSLTGALSQPRDAHGAVRLSDGRVMVAAGSFFNGYSYPTPTNSAEIYDPTKGTWGRTGSMVFPRNFPALVLLDNGKVLAIGESQTPGSTSCEIYDPASGTWSLTGALHAPRSSAKLQNSVVKLSDGRVLVEGGRDPIDPSKLVSSAEIYDPRTGVWTLTGSMNTPRVEQASSLLQDGRVLVVGGDHPYNARSTSEIFDPSTGFWTNADQTNSIGPPFSLTMLLDGRVLLLGAGWFGNVIGETSQIYDDSTLSWYWLGAFSPIMGGPAILLSDGRVFIEGGGVNGQVLSTSKIFTPRTFNISIAMSLTDTRLHPLVKDQWGPRVDIVLENGTVARTDPSRILVWLNVTNVGVESFNSARFDETLPREWTLAQSQTSSHEDGPVTAQTESDSQGPIKLYFVPAGGGRHEITNGISMATTLTDREMVSITIGEMAGMIGRSFRHGDVFVISVEITYALMGTRQSPTEYPRYNSLNSEVTVWTGSLFTNALSFAAISRHFISYAKVETENLNDGPHDDHLGTTDN